MLHSAVLVSTVQHKESALRMHASPPPPSLVFGNRHFTELLRALGSPGSCPDADCEPHMLSGMVLVSWASWLQLLAQHCIAACMSTLVQLQHRPVFPSLLIAKVWLLQQL